MDRTRPSRRNDRTMSSSLLLADRPRIEAVADSRASGEANRRHCDDAGGRRARYPYRGNAITGG
jgi:hypothetical protein